MGIKEDTGGGCSVCGDIPAFNVVGTYWLCGLCATDKLKETICATDPSRSVEQLLERPAAMLSIFDYTTNMAKPWAEAGYTCYCVDKQHPPGTTSDGNIIKVGCDIRDWLPPRQHIVFAAFAPPCTDVAVSGARWFKDKGLGGLIDALQLFDISVKLAEWANAPYLIENPVSTVSTYWRKPDYSFQPYEYGAPYYKKTCLWTGGGFVMPKKTPVEPWEGGKIWRMPPSLDRANLRSETPIEFAQAIFRENAPQGT